MFLRTSAGGGFIVPQTVPTHVVAHDTPFGVSSSADWLVTPEEAEDVLELQRQREFDELRRRELHDTWRVPGSEDEPTPKSWAIHVSAAQWNTVPAWWSGQHWFDTLLDLIGTPEHAAAKARNYLADRTLLAIAHVLRFAADPATGRHVTLSYATVRACVCENTRNGEGRTIDLRSDEVVRRAVRVLEDLGLAHVHATGRNLLSREEKAEAFSLHGRHQERAANVIALTIPTPQPATQTPSADTILDLTAEDPVKTPVTTICSHQSRKMERASRARLLKVGVFSGEERQVPQVGRSLERQRQLAWLDKHFGGALAGPRIGKRGQLLHRHIGQLDHVLARAGIDLDRWQWWQIVEQIEREFSTPKRTAVDRVIAVDDPLRYFAWMLKQVIKPGDQPRTIIPTPPVDTTAIDRTTPPHPTVPAAHAGPGTARPTLRAATEPGKDSSQLKRERRRLTEALLGPDRNPAEFPAHIQRLHTEVQTMHEYLTRRGWTLNHHELDVYGDVEFVYEPSRTAITDNHVRRYLHDTGDAINTVTTIRFIPPRYADKHHHYNVNIVGQQATDTTHPASWVHRYASTIAHTRAREF